MIRKYLESWFYDKMIVCIAMLGIVIAETDCEALSIWKKISSNSDLISLLHRLIVVIYKPLFDIDKYSIIVKTL